MFTEIDSPPIVGSNCGFEELFSSVPLVAENSLVSIFSDIVVHEC